MLHIYIELYYKTDFLIHIFTTNITLLALASSITILTAIIW